MLPRPNSDDETSIQEPIPFFDKLGHLHDADVTEFQWRPFEREITIAISDLYSNFAGVAGYDEQPQPVRLILTGVSKMQIDVASDSPPLRIRSFEASRPASCIHILATLDHDGSVQIDCEAIVCRPLTNT
jgi:hypothetical protein